MRDNPQFPSLVLTKLRSFASALGKEDVYDEHGFPSGALLCNASRMIAYSIASEISLLAVVLAQKEILPEMEIHLIVDEEDPMLATQIRGLRLDIHLWLTDGKSLVEHPQAPSYVKEEAPEEVRQLAQKLEKLECYMLEEYGTYRAEFRGIEIARFSKDESNNYQINIGVGDYDQNANSILFQYEEPETHLKEVISTIKKFRNKESSPHPLNRLGRARWLMSEAVSNPALIDLQELMFVESLLPEYEALKNSPCTAISRGEDSTTLVLSATGVDLTLVTHAAGQIIRHSPDELLLLIPEQDRHPVILRQARHLLVSPTFISITAPWPEYSENQ